MDWSDKAEVYRGRKPRESRCSSFVSLDPDGLPRVLCVVLVASISFWRGCGLFSGDDQSLVINQADGIVEAEGGDSGVVTLSMSCILVSLPQTTNDFLQ